MVVTTSIHTVVVIELIDLDTDFIQFPLSIGFEYVLVILRLFSE